MAERCKTERFKTKGSVQAGHSVNRRDLTGIIIFFADTLLYGKGCVHEKRIAIQTDTPGFFERTYDRFCSHRQTPPSIEISGEAGILRCKGGIYLSFPVFRLYSEYAYTIYRDILEKCLYELIDTPYIKTDLPAITELTLRSCDTGYILHMLNYVVTRKAKIMDTIEEKFTVCDRKIWVKTGKCPKRILKIPQKTEIAFDFENGYTCIGIEKEAGYTGYTVDF